MSKMLHVLILEDQPADAELLLYELRQAGFDLEWQLVETEAGYLAALTPTLDLILADYNLPQFDALQALQHLKKRALDIPFIVVTGSLGDEAAVEVMRQGAADYLLKDRLARLGQAVTNAIQQKRLREEKRQAEEALRAGEARFRRLFEDAPVGIALVRDNRWLSTNQTLLYLFGLREESEMAGLPMVNHIAPPQRDEFLQRLKDRGKTLPFVLETIGQRKDGTQVPIQLAIGIIDLADGPATAVYVSDITERKRLEEETLKAELLRVELAKEKELVELKDRFTSMVSHEFRTPLTVIRMSSELLAAYPDRFSPERKLRFLQEMQTQVKYMVELLDDVLTIGKARAGKIDFNPALIDVEDFCRALCEELQLADGDVHPFILSSRSHLGKLYLDERLLRHTLINLLSNAAKYSPGGGDVQLDLSAEEMHVVFRIRDQGIGIPQADQARLFEAFHRAKNAAKIQGTGLGLAIVKANVEAQGGTITFESQEGVGTTFIVRLPAVSEAAGHQGR